MKTSLFSSASLFYSLVSIAATCEGFQVTTGLQRYVPISSLLHRNHGPAQLFTDASSQQPVVVLYAVASEDLVLSKLEEMVDEPKTSTEEETTPALPTYSSSSSARSHSLLTNLVGFPATSGLLSFLSSHFSYLLSPRKQLSAIGIALVTQVVLQDVHWRFLRLLLLLAVKVPIQQCVSSHRQRLRRQRVALEASYQAAVPPRGEEQATREEETISQLLLVEMGHFALGSACLDW